MIAIDTSAIMAILLQENDAEFYAKVIEASQLPIMSSATMVELIAVTRHKKGEESVKIIENFIDIADIRIEDFTAKQAKIASAAYLQFPILNLGDCYSYALAKDKDIPLLFKGNDFNKTDIKIC